MTVLSTKQCFGNAPSKTTVYEVLFQGNFANDNTYSWGICVSSRGEISMLSLITAFY